MDSRAVDRLKHISNTEVIRRILIKYFKQKGFNESFDRPMYPSLLQDLPMALPMLSAKIEIVPHALEIDPALGRAVIGWNLFALGNQRMYLGETHHNNLMDLARQIRSGVIRPPAKGVATARRQTTPRRVVAFLTRVLGSNKAGYVDLSPLQQPVRSFDEPFRGRAAMMSMPGQYYGRAGGG